VKNRFHLPWKRKPSFKVIKPNEKKYDEIKKGTLEFCKKTENLMNIFVGFLLATAYSATIGGLATLVGTTPNIFVKGYAEK